jgi:hypothetical protein
MQHISDTLQDSLLLRVLVIAGPLLGIVWYVLGELASFVPSV